MRADEVNEETFDEGIEIDEPIESWVMDKCDQWRNHFESNYLDDFEEYYRLWRGIWHKKDSERTSERSRIIAPALQQAVESSVAELEEATFGRGKWFDLHDDLADEDDSDINYLRNKLTEDFEKTKVRKAVAECLINSAVYGTGIGEIVLSDIKEMAPATQPIMDGQLQAIGVNITERTVVTLRPVMPQNFLIDPQATSIEDAMGVAIDEFVSRHHVELMQEQGVYRDVFIPDSSPDTDLEPDQDLVINNDDKIRLTKYYGLVPTTLLKAEDESIESDSVYIEAIIVIANEGVLLKAEANPYMMQDRPVVAFPWDVVPSRFWGRGVCEKGYNSQKALDTELRARIDALALTVHPMMGMDATKLPRGSKPEVRPGKIILTNGDPREVLHPFNFGQVGQITFAQASALQQMVQQATGAVDSAGLAGSINGEATAAGISMSLGAIIKRHKRTLINFQQSFLMPFVTKAAHRYMQFDPEHYPVKDYKFNASSSLGIIAREYEVTQLTQLLQTMSPDSPVYNALIQSIVENMNLSNREELVASLKQASEPNPEAQQAQQQMQQAQLDFQMSQTEAIRAQAAESTSRAAKMAAETQAIPAELELKKLETATRNLRQGESDDKEFERRLKIADLRLKEKDLNIKDKAVTAKKAESENSKEMEQQLMQRLMPNES